MKDQKYSTTRTTRRERSPSNGQCTAGKIVGSLASHREHSHLSNQSNKPMVLGGWLLLFSIRCGKSFGYHRRSRGKEGNPDKGKKAFLDTACKEIQRNKSRPVKRRRFFSTFLRNSFLGRNISSLGLDGLCCLEQQTHSINQKAMHVSNTQKSKCLFWKRFKALAFKVVLFVLILDTISMSSAVGL